MTTWADRPGPISVWGLGKLGLPVAAVFAERFGGVTGVDVDPTTVATITDGDTPFDHEPGLASLVDRLVAADRLTATTDGAGAARTATVHVVVVPTLLTDEREPSMDSLRGAIEIIGAGLDPGDLVLVESTVPPGTTRDLVAPVLVEESGLERTKFLLAYCPERTASGTALRDIRGQYPKVVGGVDDASGRAAAAIYDALSSNEVHEVSDATTAEFVKLFEGVYRDVNIALANEFALLGATWDVSVREAIQTANALPMCDIHAPGPGVGGHCIPVYPHFLRDAAAVTPSLIERARTLNRVMPAKSVERLASILESEGETLAAARVAVLGLTYRSNVPETRYSPGLAVVAELERTGATVFGIDPYVDPSGVDCRVEDRSILSEEPPDAAVVAAAHDAFEDIEWSALEPMVILDGRDALDLGSSPHRVHVLGGGRDDRSVDSADQSVTPGEPIGGE